MNKKERKKYEHTKEYYERIYTRPEHRHIRKATKKSLKEYLHKTEEEK